MLGSGVLSREEPTSPALSPPSAYLSQLYLCVPCHRLAVSYLFQPCVLRRMKDVRMQITAKVFSSLFIIYFQNIKAKRLIYLPFANVLCFANSSLAHQPPSSVGRRSHYTTSHYFALRFHTYKYRCLSFYQS